MASQLENPDDPQNFLRVKKQSDLTSAGEKIQPNVRCSLRYKWWLCWDGRAPTLQWKRSILTNPLGGWRSRYPPPLPVGIKRMSVLVLQDHVGTTLVNAWNYTLNTGNLAPSHDFFGLISVHFLRLLGTGSRSRRVSSCLISVALFSSHKVMLQ